MDMRYPNVNEVNKSVRGTLESAMHDVLLAFGQLDDTFYDYVSSMEEKHAEQIEKLNGEISELEIEIEELKRQLAEGESQKALGGGE
jgi:hypothetical protein